MTNTLEQIEQVRRALGAVKLVADKLQEMAELYGPEDRETINAAVNGNSLDKLTCTLNAAFWYGIDAQEALDDWARGEK